MAAAQRLQDLALLGDVHALEGVEVGRVHREEADELVHALVHRAVERREALQVLANERLLLRRPS